MQFFFFLRFITSVYCVSVWNVWYMCAGAREDRGTYPGPGVLGGVSHLTLVLGTELRPSGKQASVGAEPALQPGFLNKGSYSSWNKQISLGWVIASSVNPTVPTPSPHLKH